MITKETILDRAIYRSDDIVIHVNEETKLIYKNLPSRAINKVVEVSLDEFNSLLNMDMSGLGYQFKNKFIKVLSRYTYDNKEYIVCNLYVPGMMYEENIVLDAGYLNSMTEVELDLPTSFK